MKENKFFVVFWIFSVIIFSGFAFAANPCTDGSYYVPSGGGYIDVTCKCGPSTGDYTWSSYIYRVTTNGENYMWYERIASTGNAPRASRFCNIASNHGVFGASNACPSKDYDITFRVYDASSSGTRRASAASGCGATIGTGSFSMQDYIKVMGWNEAQPPVIWNVWSEYPAGTNTVYHPYSFRLWVEVSDDTDISSILFPTWSDPNGQNDLVWHSGIYSHTSGGHEFWYADVDRTTNHPDPDYAGYNGMHLTTHVYAYDPYNNQVGYGSFGGTYIYKDNGYTCSVDRECASNNCDTDYDSSTKYCHATASSCPNGPGTTEYVNGYELCSGNSWYKSCSSGTWASQQNCDTTPDYAYTTNQCGWQTQAVDTCSSGSSGGCSAPSWVPTDCGEFNTTSTSSCNHNGELAYCSTTCGATCNQGETHDSGTNYCSGGDSYNRIDICNISGTDCLWYNNEAMSDTLNQVCGLFNCSSGSGDCYSSCSEDDDSKCIANYHCYSGDSACYNNSIGSLCDIDSECESGAVCSHNSCAWALADSPSGTTYTDSEGDNINSTIRIAYLNKNNFNFIKLEVSDAISLSGSFADTNGRHSVFHFGSASRAGLEKINLLIDKIDESDYVFVCPNQASISDPCIDAVILNITNSSSDVYSLVNLTDPDYWHIEADADDFSTGGYSGPLGGGADVPEFGFFGAILVFVVALITIGYVRKIN